MWPWPDPRSRSRSLIFEFPSRKAVMRVQDQRSRSLILNSHDSFLEFSKTISLPDTGHMWTIILVKQSLHYSPEGPARTLSWNVLIAHCTWRRDCTKWDRRDGLTSSNVDISQNSNGHISFLHNATVTWLGKLLVLHVLCTLIWPWPYRRSRSRSIWTSDNCPYLHISRSISSATFERSSKLAVGSHSMGPGLQLVGARFRISF